MKRTVRFWVLTCIGNRGRQHIARNSNVWTRKEAREEAIVGQVAIPCTITYDDGAKPKRRGKK